MVDPYFGVSPVSVILTGVGPTNRGMEISVVLRTAFGELGDTQ